MSAKIATHKHEWTCYYYNGLLSSYCLPISILKSKYS